MKNHDKKFYIYLPNVKEPIEVSEKVYRAYYQPIWRTWKFAQKYDRCILNGGNWYRCQGDCGVCVHQITGDSLSLDDELSDDFGTFSRKDILATESTPFDEVLADAELLDKLLSLLDEQTPENKAICQCIMNGMSDRTASETLNIPRTSYKRRVNKLLPRLKKILEEYF